MATIPRPPPAVAPADPVLLTRRRLLQTATLATLAPLAGCRPEADGGSRPLPRVGRSPRDPAAASPPSALDRRTARRARALAWSPANTWVFAVCVVEWLDRATYASFPQTDRRDLELMAVFRDRGVPARQVVFLRDAEATQAAIRTRLEEHLARAGACALFWFYYAGHGYLDAGGEGWFAPYDAGEDLATTWVSVNAVVEAVERRAATGRGAARCLLTADCCHAGALVEQAQKPGRRVPYAALTSSLAEEDSTGDWTFSEGLIAGLRGEGRVDLDANGEVTLAELATYVEDEMVFCNDQLSGYGVTPGFPESFVLAPVGTGARPDQGARERVEVLSEGRWYRALVLAREATRARVHYVGYGAASDAWVALARVRPYAPVTYAPGTPVEVEWHGTWYPATVRARRRAIHFVHYAGYEATSDEWVPSQRIRAPRAIPGPLPGVTPRAPTPGADETLHEAVAGGASVAGS